MTRYVALIDGEAGAYGVIFPDLPGCAAMGKTVEMAMTNAAASLRDWVIVASEGGAAIPSARAVEDIRSDPATAEALSAGATLVSVPLVVETGRPVRANLSLDTGILAAIDAEAERRHLTRSAFVELMAKHALPELAG